MKKFALVLAALLLAGCAAPAGSVSAPGEAPSQMATDCEAVNPAAGDAFANLPQGSVIFTAMVLECGEDGLLVGPDAVDVGKFSPPDCDCLVDRVWVTRSETANPLSGLQIGDVVRVAFDGCVAESQPPQVQALALEKAEGLPLARMALVGGVMYYDTGLVDNGGRCGMMDGEVTGGVLCSQRPTEEGQSNFGPCGYQYGRTEDTLEFPLNGQWVVFRAGTLYGDDLVLEPQTEQSYFVTFRVTVQQVEADGSFVAAPEEGSREAAISRLYAFPGSTDATTPVPGDVYEIRYRGDVLKTVPATVQELLDVERAQP